MPNNIVDGSQPTIDILIGSDYYFEILTSEIVRGDSGPVAVNSKFGWVVSGPTQDRRGNLDMSVGNLVIKRIGPQNSDIDNEHDTELSHALRRFWDIELLESVPRERGSSCAIYNSRKRKAGTKYNCLGRITAFQSLMAV